MNPTYSKFFALLVEVAGHIGELPGRTAQAPGPTGQALGGHAPPPSRAPTTSDSALVPSVHYILDDSFSDCIISAEGVFLINDALKEKLLEIKPTGVTFAEAHVSMSEQFYDNTGNNLDWVAPHLNWLIVDGTVAVDDFGTALGLYTLVVSARVWERINATGVSFCRAVEYDITSGPGFLGPFGQPRQRSK